MMMLLLFKWDTLTLVLKVFVLYFYYIFYIVCGKNFENCENILDFHSMNYRIIKKKDESSINVLINDNVCFFFNKKFLITYWYLKYI